MITLKELQSLKDNDGLTLKNGLPITYKSGWQVADYGIETKDAKKAFQAVKRFGGSCGVWFSNGIYYVDHSFRVSHKRDAMRIGRENNQLSILRWNDLKLFDIVREG